MMKLTECKTDFGTGCWNGVFLAVPLWVLILWLTGCATSGRVTQGLNNSCGLYALADAIEIQTHKSLSREERLRVWRTMRDPDHATLTDVFAAAQVAGWVSDRAWLCASELDTINGPVLADIGKHLVCILSVSSGKVTYLDPRYQDPQSVTVRQMERMHDGMYWRVMNK